MIRTLLSASVAMAIAMPATAETSVQMEVLRKVEIVNVEDEVIETTYEQVSTVTPGENLIYRISLSNTDPVPATAVSMKFPVDSHVQIDPASVTYGSDFQALFSVDGGENFGDFARLQIEENGDLRAATPDDITHMTVAIVEIPASTTMRVEYNAIVE